MKNETPKFAITYQARIDSTYDDLAIYYWDGEKFVPTYKLDDIKLFSLDETPAEYIKALRNLSANVETSFPAYFIMVEGDASNYNFGIWPDFELQERFVDYTD